MALLMSWPQQGLVAALKIIHRVIIAHRGVIVML